MGDYELTDEEAAAEGLPPAAPAAEPPQTSGGEHPLPTTVPVREVDGSVAPIDAGQPAPPRQLTDDEAEAEGLPTPRVQAGNAIGYVAKNTSTTDDQAADIIKYSAASGLPANLVAADLENVKKKVDASGVDWGALAKHHPELADYLLKNPHAIPLVQNDLQNLGTINATFSHRLSRAWLDAWHEQGTVGLQVFHALGYSGFDKAIEQRLGEEQKSKEQFGPEYGATNLLSRGILQGTKMLPYVLLNETFDKLGALAGGLGGAAAGVETGPGAAVTGAAGAVGGDLLASFAFNTLEALGPKSWELDHAVDADGRPIPRIKADLGATADAIASGALMAFGFGVFGKGTKFAGKYLPAASEALQGLSKSTVVRWLDDGPIKGLVSRALGRFGLSAGAAFGMMAGTAGVNEATNELVKGTQGNVPKAMWDGGWNALGDMWLLSLVDPNFRAGISRVGDMVRSHQDAAKLNGIVQAAKNSTTLQKSPEAFQQIVQAAAPDAKVYIPAKKWVSYFQGKKIDPAEVAKGVGVSPEALQTAVSSGGNVEMPVAQFLGKLTQDGHAEALQRDAKLDPNAETANQAKESQARETERIVGDAKTRADELERGKQTVKDYYIAQARAAKHRGADVEANAQIVADAVATTALRLNTSMGQAAHDMRLGDLTITGKAGVTPEHQALVSAFRDWMLPDATQELRAKQATKDPLNVAREVYLDTNTGQPNEAHYTDLAEHEAATAFPSDDRLHANASIEGVKFINDNLGHDQGNLLIRAAGKALHEAAPELGVSRTQHDFELRVKDQAHLDEILAKANANLPPELQGLRITGAAGATRDAALEAHKKLKVNAEAEGKRAPRVDAQGNAVKPLGFKGDVKTLKFAEAKVSAEVHPELAKNIAGMSKEDRFNKAYVGPDGLLNNLAWQHLDHDGSHHYALLDVRGLGAAQEAYGKDGADTLNRGFAKILAHYGGSSFDAAHLHGDEYALRHKDPYRLSKFVDTVREKLRGKFLASLQDGEKVDVGVRFWHGIAKGSLDAADRSLNDRKAADKAQTALLAGRAPAGVEDRGNASGRRGDLAFRGENIGQGAQPQGLRGPGERGRGDEGQGPLGPGPGGTNRPQDLAAARAFVGRMRNQDQAKKAGAFIDWVQAWHEDKVDKNQPPPEIPQGLERKIAGFFVIDPRHDIPQWMTYGEKAKINRENNQTGSGGIIGSGASVGGAMNMPGGLRDYWLNNSAAGYELSDSAKRYRQEQVVAHVEGRPVTLEQAQRPVTLTPEFKNWFGESKVVDEKGEPLVVYHGTKRPDRVGAVFRKSRATSGPMAFFTDSAELASRYAMQKADTSVEPPEDYSGWFKMKVGRSDVDLDRAWFHLSQEQKSNVSELMPHVVQNDDGDIVLEKGSFGPGGKGHYDHELKEARGNVLKAIKETWLNGGMLVDREEKFMEVLDLGGAGGLLKFDPPDAEYPGVYPTFLSIKHPLDTASIGPEVFDALEKAHRRQPSQSERGTDAWYKHTRTPAEWVETLKSDLANDSTHAWTSIPDWVTRTLKKLGYDGIKDVSGKGGGDQHGVWIPFEENQVKSATGNRGTFDPKSKNILKSEGRNGEPPRGEIRLDVADTGSPRSFNIQVLKGDRSTLAHETAHFLSWSLHDLAHSDLATPDIKSDYETLLKFAGYKDSAERLEALKSNSGAKQEEKISHAWEAWLAEGKAPSTGLARVFSRFKGWMLRIYNGVSGIADQYKAKYGEDLQLSDEVRGVFERLIARDEAVKSAGESVGEAGPLPEAMEGMTPEQVAKYRSTLADAAALADSEAGGGGDEQQEALDEKREVFRKQSAEELDQKPIYRAWRYLQHGDTPDGPGPVDENGKPYKINRASFEESYGPERAKLMPPGSLKRRSGVDVDQLAPLLGFQSGPGLVDALTHAIPRDQAIEGATQDKMDQAFGPELERQTEAALSGVHNDKGLEAAVQELRGLAKKINPSLEQRAHSIDTEAIRKSVDRLTGEKYVDGLDPAKYARTERSLAIEAAELWGKGEKEAAYDKREQRVLNKIMFMSERDAKRELDAARRRIANPSEAARSDLGKADPAFRDVHDKLLAAVGLGRPPQGEGLKGVDDLVNVLDDREIGAGPWVDTARQLLAQPANWDSSLTVNRARDVVDAVKQMRAAADDELNAVVLGKKQSLDEIRTAIRDRVSTIRSAMEKPKYGGLSPGFVEKFKAFYRRQSTAFKDIEAIAEMLDGGTEGPAHDLFIHARLEARDREIELIKLVLGPIKEAYEKIPKELLKLRGQEVDVGHLLPPPDGREPGYVRSDLWALFLNMGNEGNIQRLIDGNKWDPHKMRQAVSLLHAPELEFLQKVRDIADTLFPHLAEAYERRTGLKLEKVQATPIIVNGQEYRGGYWPIRYDKSAEGNQGERQEINDIKDLFPSSRAPTVTNSSTKARQEKVLAPIVLDWGTGPAHFAQVIHDIAMGDWVRQAAKVVMKPRIPDANVPSFNKTATDYLGPERAREFLPWLRDVASARADSTSGHMADALRDGNPLRSRLAAATIMLNIPASVRHLVDPWTTMADSESVAPHHIAAAYTKVMNPASWGNILEFKLSKELEARRVTHDDNLRAELRKMGKVSGFLERATEVGFLTHKWMDMFTTRVGFKAAYDQAIADGMTQVDAVKRADDVVRRSFPSTDIAEKPPILRTRQGWAAAIMFYGYASKMHNLRSRSFDKLARAWSVGETTGTDVTAPEQPSKPNAVAEVAAKYIGLGLVGALGSYLASRGPTRKDDDEKGVLKSRAEWLSTEVLLSGLDDVPPIIGPAVKATLLGHKTNIGSVPELMLLDHQLERLGKMMHGKKSDEDSTPVLSTVEALVGGLGPLGQAQRSGEYLKKLSTGEEQPRGPLDVVSGALLGKSKNQGANPLTDLQRVISGR